MEPSSLPRFEATQRREFLKRAAAVAGLALIPALAACSKGDEDTFADASTTTAAGETSATSTTASANTGEALPGGAALEVAFTFAATSGSGGPSRNPFVAAWVESATGDLVANIAVWYDPPKGDRWINNLASWYTAVSETSSDYLETTTGATQPAGTHTLSWDGTDVDGARAAQGDYVVYLESAQEHGNHSFTSAPVSLGTSKTNATLPDDGDLSAATVSFTV